MHYNDVGIICRYVMMMMQIYNELESVVVSKLASQHEGPVFDSRDGLLSIQIYYLPLDQKYTDIKTVRTHLKDGDASFQDELKWH